MGRRERKVIRLVLLAVIGSAVWAYNSFGWAELDGSAWDVKVRAQAVFALPRRDTLVFDRGHFSSAKRLAEGFLPAHYSFDRSAENFGHFTASQKGEDGSTLQWRGVIRGDRVKGTLWRVTERGAEKYSFRGRRRS